MWWAYGWTLKRIHVPRTMWDGLATYLAKCLHREEQATAKRDGSSSGINKQGRASLRSTARPGKCEFMVCNGTTDTLLDDYAQGRPTGLALRNFWDSVLEYMGRQYDDDMSKATIPQLRATSMVMLLSL